MDNFCSTRIPNWIIHYRYTYIFAASKTGIQPTIRCCSNENIKIVMKTGFARLSVGRIINEDVQLKCPKMRCAQDCTATKCEKRFVCSRRQLLLLLLQQIPILYDVDSIFFGDEKVFAVAPSVNLQYDRVRAPTAIKKCDILCLAPARHTIHIRQVRDVVSEFGCTGVNFSASVGTESEWCIIIIAKLFCLNTFPPATHHIAGDFYIFQHDTALVHHARGTIGLLQHVTSDIITPDMWRPNCPALNPVDCRIWGVIL